MSDGASDDEHILTVGRPVGLLAELTHRCPLQCLYCSNGEPTARRDLEGLVGGAARVGLYTNLITAGVTLKSERVRALADAGLDHVQISLQDTTEDGTEIVTKYRRGLERKIAAARAVREAGLALTINAPVHRLNLTRLPDMIDLAVELGAERLEVAHVQYLGWALRNRAGLMPTRVQVEESVEVVSAARDRLRGVLVIDFVAPDYYAVQPKPCMGGWGCRFMVVTPSGMILPCHGAQSLPGLAFENARDRTLHDAWFHGSAFWAYRGTSWMKEPCRSCPQREVDFGGCRCQALALTGDATNADPVCALSEHHSLLPRECSDASGYRQYRSRQAV